MNDVVRCTISHSEWYPVVEPNPLQTSDAAYSVIAAGAVVAVGVSVSSRNANRHNCIAFPQRARDWLESRASLIKRRGNHAYRRFALA